MDPDNYSPGDIKGLFEVESGCKPDMFLVGGSLTKVNPEGLVLELKENFDIPVILFPGSLLQLTGKADGILFISLISGRNPELLIGNHVLAAPYLKKAGTGIIPTGYILVNCGIRTSVEYMSQTEAIPSNKTDIAVATALAGEMLGLKAIYLEGGSGASHPVPPAMIRAVRDAISVPLIVGGGLKTGKDIKQAYQSGADLVVIGNGFESNPGLLKEACSIRNSL